MGKPGGRHGPSPAAERIGGVEGTRGSETSQYPQEEKTTVIPGVVASETGPGQTAAVDNPAGVAAAGLWERASAVCRRPGE
jgi:hypothetical protein